ncbi:hypothetical protein HS048_23455 [Planomonospora sp. ID91781]|uniref:Uncharacterized protein n=1 Tax=Planomonospora sphaerica TaxID=161355 RepID=A0A171CXJ2_9ACTN|nr:hypothetical protein [Planomonospora sp. ID91781]MBG0823681.1 hypothetical protein [Planomonospora sp. ID91781]GAT67381.1 hypothetical protein PS9374_03034 [Planomonospora sphaerica]
MSRRARDAMPLILPPALGAFTAGHGDSPLTLARTAACSASTESAVAEPTWGGFIGCAHAPPGPSPAGRKARMIGLAASAKGGRNSHQPRMQIRRIGVCR